MVIPESLFLLKLTPPEKPEYPPQNSSFLPFLCNPLGSSLQLLSHQPEQQPKAPSPPALWFSPQQKKSLFPQKNISNRLSKSKNLPLPDDTPLHNGIRSPYIPLLEPSSTCQISIGSSNAQLIP